MIGFQMSCSDAHLRTARRRGFSSSSSSFESSSSSPWSGRKCSPIWNVHLTNLSPRLHHSWGSFFSGLCSWTSGGWGKTSVFQDSVSKTQLCNMRKAGVHLIWNFLWNSWEKVLIRIKTNVFGIENNWKAGQIDFLILWHVECLKLAWKCWWGFGNWRKCWLARCLNKLLLWTRIPSNYIHTKQNTTVIVCNRGVGGLVMNHF